MKDFDTKNIEAYLIKKVEKGSASMARAASDMLNALEDLKTSGLIKSR